MQTIKKYKNQIIIIAIITIAIIALVILTINNKLKQKIENQIQDYIPAEEMSSEQLRKTIVSLYFPDKEQKNLIPEARTIDVKEIVNEPYKTLINLLIQGPKDEKLEKCMPEGTQIKNIKLQNNILIIDFSKEFIENHEGGAQKESNTIYSLVNTLTQLNEIDSIKILIEGQENQAFKDNNIKFSEIFVKTE